MKFYTEHRVAHSKKENERLFHISSHVGECWDTLSWVRNISNVGFFPLLTNERVISTYLIAASVHMTFNMVSVTVSVWGCVN